MAVTLYPLFRMLWCDSVAPFGNPVVPDVYWMLIGSSNCSDACRSASWSALASLARPTNARHVRSPCPLAPSSRITVWSAGSFGRTSAIMAA
jgi:hypothetical protein